MKSWIQIIVFALLVALAGCKGCDQEVKPIKPDPCKGKSKVNTFFKVRPGDRGFRPPHKWCELVPCDTFNSSSVLFEVPDGNPNSTYEWNIGSETEPRTGKKFEIDFSDYLNNGKWETFLPVSLTTRTPYNSCLDNAGDTLITVARSLFFTEKWITLMGNNTDFVEYKGYLTDKPSTEINLKFIRKKVGSFRGENSPLFLLVGLPDIDTLMYPKIACGNEFCYNYKHQTYRYPNIIHCPSSPLTNFMVSNESIFIQGNRRLKATFTFSRPSGNKQYQFVGTRL